MGVFSSAIIGKGVLVAAPRCSGRSRPKIVTVVRQVDLVATLIIKSGKLSGKKLVIAHDHELLLGRDTSCSLCLTSNAVSRKHCLLRSDNSALFVRDLGSRTGTLVNDQPIDEETELYAGDRLSIGPFLFQVADDSPALTESRQRELKTDTGGDEESDAEVAADTADELEVTVADIPAAESAENVNERSAANKKPKRRRKRKDASSDVDDDVLNWLTDGSGPATTTLVSDDDEQNPPDSASGARMRQRSADLSDSDLDDFDDEPLSLDDDADDDSDAAIEVQAKEYNTTRDIAADILRGEFSEQDIPESKRRKKKPKADTTPKSPQEQIKEFVKTKPQYVAAGVIAVLLVIFLKWPSSDDPELFVYLESVAAQIQKNRDDNVGRTKWNEFKAQVTKDLKPVVAQLKKTASNKEPVKQEMLHLADSLLPAYLHDEPYGGMPAKKQVEYQLAMIKEMLNSDENPHEIRRRWGPKFVPPEPVQEPDGSETEE